MKFKSLDSLNYNCAAKNDLAKLITLPANIYLLKVDNRNTRARCEICSKLTVKTPERHQKYVQS